MGLTHLRSSPFSRQKPSSDITPSLVLQIFFCVCECVWKTERERQSVMGTWGDFLVLCGIKKPEHILTASYLHVCVCVGSDRYWNN